MRCGKLQDDARTVAARKVDDEVTDLGYARRQQPPVGELSVSTVALAAPDTSARPVADPRRTVLKSFMGISL